MNFSCVCMCSNVPYNKTVKERKKEKKRTRLETCLFALLLDSYRSLSSASVSCVIFKCLQGMLGTTGAYSSQLSSKYNPVSLLWRNLLLPTPLLPSPAEDAGQPDWSWALTPHGCDHPVDSPESRSGIRFIFCVFGFSLKILHPHSLDSWQHDGTRIFTLGIILIMVRFKCTFSRSRSWGFIPGPTGFSQHDGYTWVRSAETFCCWDFGWVRLFCIILCQTACVCAVIGGNVTASHECLLKLELF